jgi:hypothetical protein
MDDTRPISEAREAVIEAVGEAMTRPHEDAAAEIAAVWAVFRRASDANAEAWEREHGEPMPRTIEDFTRWAMRLGDTLPRFDERTFAELLPAIEGYLLRLRDERGGKPVAADAPKLTGSESEALDAYRRASDEWRELHGDAEPTKTALCELAVERGWVASDKPDSVRRTLDRALRKVEGARSSARESRSAVDIAGERVSR